MIEHGERPDILRGLRVALVHDYLNQAGGAEHVLDVFSQMFPDAPIFTSVFDAAAMPPSWRTKDVRTSFMQRISPKLAIAKLLIPLYPTAFESFDLSDFDLVLSSTTSFAKGVITGPSTCHVCYCNTPTRFLWMYHDYLRYERTPGATRRLLPWMMTPLRLWDYAAAQRVDYFIAGSRNSARRIAKYYRRDSEVVHSPIDVSRFAPSSSVGGYLLVISRLQPYKRIDLAVEACNRLGVSLKIAGEGPDRKRLESIAGRTVELLGRVTDEQRRRLLAECRAFIFPGEEDYGLTPIEAMASGRPVVAYRAGGALETVEEGITGVFFDRQDPRALADAIRSLPDAFDPAAIRAHAQRFDVSVFQRRMFELLAAYVADHRRRFAA